MFDVRYWLYLDWGRAEDGDNLVAMELMSSVPFVPADGCRVRIRGNFVSRVVGVVWDDYRKSLDVQISDIKVKDVDAAAKRFRSMFCAGWNIVRVHGWHPDLTRAEYSGLHRFRINGNIMAADDDEYELLSRAGVGEEI